MAIKKFCDEHGIVDATHNCRGTDNQRRARLNKLHGTNTTYWRRLRRLALQRDGGLCQLRHRGCTQLADSVHIDPHLNGNHRIATLGDCTSACKRCHGVEDAPRATPRW